MEPLDKGSVQSHAAAVEDEYYWRSSARLCYVNVATAFITQIAAAALTKVRPTDMLLLGEQHYVGV